MGDDAMAAGNVVDRMQEPRLCSACPTNFYCRSISEKWINHDRCEILHRCANEKVSGAAPWSYSFDSIPYWSYKHTTAQACGINNETIPSHSIVVHELHMARLILFGDGWTRLFGEGYDTWVFANIWKASQSNFRPQHDATIQKDDVIRGIATAAVE